MILAYLVLVETAKVWYFRRLSAPVPTVRRRGLATRVVRRAARFTERSAHSQSG
jgi:Mg2+-importing ATPase